MKRWDSNLLCGPLVVLRPRSLPAYPPDKSRRCAPGHRAPELLGSVSQDARRVGLALGLFMLLLLPAHTAVATTIMSLPQLRQIATHYLHTHFAGEGLPVQIKVRPPDPRLRLAKCATPPRASLPSGRLFGSRVSVRLACAGPVPWMIYLPAQVHVFRRVLVATRALGRGDLVGRHAVRWQRYDVSLLGYGYIEHIPDIAGRRLLRPISPGTVLSPGMFAIRLLVHRGDHVSILTEVGRVHVRAHGTALGNGAAGARVKVRNSNSGRIIQGLVVSTDTVQVQP
mgnify:CR=1 FL=1